MREPLFRQFVCWFGSFSVPIRPWPQVFYVSRYIMESDSFEIRPLTVMGLVKGITKNFITMNWWRLLYLLYKMGFFDLSEGEMFRANCWRWRFWKVIKKREQNDSIA